ncbi:hypothetical protein [Thermoplasma volcanium GSS1]|uniref:ArsA/GET3 Anion-transporting ATPase-like domain-containing protein n=1 Tax=Thermoplasma volcanium (strain ATCC 51530 / DSM 4299 / JCM 9571 / NBRC 15438 / GSS1) TaxID=273116 RepID=Q97CS5_THEVO|nr:ArsA family ATPase [Thermoplasma volcanium]BAB59168.1 hypothetical protein [Thermoplasma volcanium GSS1]
MIEAFVGKGGVGKTTIAAAYSLICAEHGSTAIVSTDTMPSLHYIFPENTVNLDVFEISESEVSKLWKKRYGDQVYDIVSRFFDTGFEIIDHIANAPGVAEEFMISQIVGMGETKKFDYLVWDTPASSSTMHLLYLEKDFYEHLGRDIKFYFSMKDAFKTNKTLEILNEWRELSKKVWNEIENSKFYLVSTHDELSLLQSYEIEEDLKRMGISVSARIYNRTSQHEGYITIPELQGTAREIVEKAKPFLRKLFNSTHGK